MTSKPTHPAPERLSETILSGSRVLGGSSENVVAIPAVDPAANRRSDNKGEVADPSPIAPPARSSRRGFLMNSILSIASLASATAITATEAVSQPTADRRALEAYASWLFMERRLLCMALYPDLGIKAERYDFALNAGYGWHFRGSQDWRDLPQPASRAVAILDLVGVDWRNQEHSEWQYVDSGRRPSIAGFSAADSQLVTAVREIQILDLRIQELHDKFGDDADGRDDYHEMEARRDEVLEILATIPARSHEGLVAKAEALTQRRLIEDFERHGAVASSLADDVLRYFGARIDRSTEGERAVTSPPTAPSNDRRLFEIEAEVQALVPQLKLFASAQGAADQKHADWERSNPQPGADQKKAAAKWRKEHRALLREYEDADEKWNAALGHLDALYLEAASLRAGTARGLRCKARVCGLEGGRADPKPELIDSIVRDVLTIAI